MPHTTKANDNSKRQQALNIEESFIVQAPAGSGKTTLLVQRFLALLVKVKNPEEIIAITFTKKAALEMKKRIIESLQQAEKIDNEAALEPHKLTTYRLAKNALLTNQKLKWNLLEKPERLKIQTIDALCNSIAKQLPLLSSFVTETNILESAETFKYYNLAIKMILQNFDDTLLEEFYLEKLETLLFYLDNDRSRIRNLMVEMLSNRDQWLSHFLMLRNIKNIDQTKLRNILQQSLKNITTETIENFHQTLPKTLYSRQSGIPARRAQDEYEEHTFRVCNEYESKRNNARNLSATSIESEIKTLADFAANNLININNATIPENNYFDLKYLKFIAKIYLTDELQWRKIVNKNQGFPSKDDAINKEEKELFIQMKLRMKALLQALENYPEFHLCLIDIKKCPPEAYSDEQWEIISSLLELLPLIVAQLKLLFKENKTADFIEVAMAANTALGNEDNPTELALNLDYRIKHLLVDEFQDTSISQYNLLEKLTKGWENGDGRTLFIVGDPMQSIYRFRQAEVSLFMRAKNEGLGAIRFIPLSLSLNYRSTKNIINWLNTNFEKILPKNHNSSYGAVAFSKTETLESNTNIDSTVKVHLLENAESKDEANYVASLIQNIRSNNPKQSIAILGRSRTHFIDIIQELKNKNITFSAVELETLDQNEIIKDLFALTRAIYDLYDNVAWFAILRAPWCGLALDDLHKIAQLKKNEHKNTIIFELLCNSIDFLGLTNIGLTAIKRILPFIIDAVYNRQKQNFRETIEKVWRQIGGPACLSDENKLATVEVFFNLLEKLNKDDYLDIELLENSLQQLYSQQNVLPKQTPSDGECIQFMTIHKAKGLEFDNVFIVGIDREVKNDSKKLMLWTQRILKHNDSDLLLAPINSAENNKEPIYEYLQNIETRKSYYEIGRLLYVAATRAKKNLYLTGKIKIIEDENNNFQKPGKNSFLEQLWSMFSPEWVIKNNYQSKIAASANNNEITRLSAEWIHPFADKINSEKFATHNKYSNYKFTLLDAIPKQIGTVIHKCLQHLCKDYERSNSFNIENYIEKQSYFWKILLFEHGCIFENDVYLNKIINSIKNIFHDPRGKWILQNNKEAKNEYEITTVINDTVERFIIDRTFIDSHDNRWIIDYKTSAPKNQKINEFLEDEFQLYKNQLEQYACALRKIETRKIFLGLYFPLCQAWKEWEYLL